MIIVDSRRFPYTILNFKHNFYLINRYHQKEMENTKANTITADIARENELNLKLGKKFQCLLRCFIDDFFLNFFFFLIFLLSLHLQTKNG